MPETYDCQKCDDAIDAGGNKVWAIIEGRLMDRGWASTGDGALVLCMECTTLVLDVMGVDYELEMDAEGL